MGFAVKVSFKIRIPSVGNIAGSISERASPTAVKRKLKSVSRQAVQTMLTTSINAVGMAYQPQVKNFEEPVFTEDVEDEPPPAQDTSEGDDADGAGVGLVAIIIPSIFGALCCCCCLFGVYRYYAKKADEYSLDPFAQDIDISPSLSYHKSRSKAARAMTKELSGPWASPEHRKGASNTREFEGGYSEYRKGASHSRDFEVEHRKSPAKARTRDFDVAPPERRGKGSAQEFDRASSQDLAGDDVDLAVSVEVSSKRKQGSATGSYAVGDAVEVRAAPDDEWTRAYVVNADPLHVRVASAPHDAPAMSWPYVRQARVTSASKWEAIKADLVASQTLGDAIVVNNRSRKSKASTALDPQRMREGEKVWVRSHPADPWQEGIVVDAERLHVRLENSGPDAFPTAWKYICREADDGEDDDIVSVATDQLGRESARRSRGWRPVSQARGKSGSQKMRSNYSEPVGAVKSKSSAKSNATKSLSTQQ